MPEIKDCKPDYERRCFIVDELRVSADNEDKKPIITGYAAVFNSLSEEMWGMREQIERGAFEETIKTDDVRALFNHDPNIVLGRTKNGTLKLSEDDRGLKIEILPPGTQQANDVVALIDRGDISQMSFGFQTIEDSWETKDGINIRTLKKIKLFDTSAVTFPAYTDTTVGLRTYFEAVKKMMHDEIDNSPTADDIKLDKVILDGKRKKLALYEKLSKNI